jgi:heat shock protein HslJ
MPTASMTVAVHHPGARRRLYSNALIMLVLLCSVGSAVALAGPAVPDAPVVNTYWRDGVIAGEPVGAGPRQHEPHFVLTAQGNRMHGSTGCNQCMGAYEQTDHTLRFKGVATTRRACPPAASAMEKAFLRALEATATFRIAGNSLDLMDAEGKVRMHLEAQYLR